MDDVVNREDVYLTLLCKHDQDDYDNHLDNRTQRFDVKFSQPINPDWLYKVIEDALKRDQRRKKKFQS
jgi:hypothetical protein